jgi:hypothetical protein
VAAVEHDARGCCAFAERRLWWLLSMARDERLWRVALECSSVVAVVAVNDWIRIWWRSTLPRRSMLHDGWMLSRRVAADQSEWLSGEAGQLMIESGCL